MQYYQIIKFRQNGSPRIQKGYGRLTLEQARKICQDPETSSMTASTACKGNPETIARWHEKQKHWFLGYKAIN